MKWFIFAFVILFTGIVNAQFYDDDGQLGLEWQTPEPCIENCATITGYQISYTINGVSDSITVNIPDTTVLQDSSAFLANYDDWAVAEIVTVGVTSNGGTVYSFPAISDTAYYKTGTNVNPPTGVTWK